MDRVADLRSDYDRLGTLLATEEDGAKAASLARERRILGGELARLATPEEASVADELAARRRAPTEDARPASRRRRSGGG